MKKRILFCLISVVVCALSVCGVCSCGEDFGNSNVKCDHIFDQEVTSSKYLRSEATCLSKAQYYYSCSKCGAKGTEVFEVGELGDHKYNGNECETCGNLIEKKDYDMSAVVFDDETVVYDGNVHNLTARDLPQGVTVEYFIGDDDFEGAIDVGKYTVTAKFTGDEKTHNLISDKEAVLTIKKATIDMSNIIFRDSVVQFDRTKHSIKVANLPASIDPNDVVYYYNNDETDGVVSGGVYTVTAVFNVSDNYEPVANKEATLTVLQEDYKHLYEQYTEIGRTIDLIHASDITSLSGSKRVFTDELYNNNIIAQAYGKQEGKGSSTTDYTKALDDVAEAVDLKVAFGSRKDKNSKFMTNRLPSIDVEAAVGYERKKESDTYEYHYTYTYDMYAYTYEIEGRNAIDYYSTILSADLIADVQKVQEGKMSPETFIRTWGTHVIMASYHGARVDMNYSEVSTDKKTDENWKAKLDVEFQARFSKTGLDISANIDYSKFNSTTTKSKYSQFKVNAKSTRPVSGTSLEGFVDSYRTWNNNYNQATDSVFMDVPDGSLYCIWDLLGDKYVTAKSILDEYMYTSSLEQYNQKLAKINGLKLQNDVVFDSITGELKINMETYQAKDSGLSGFEVNNYVKYENGVLNITPYYASYPVKSIYINGAYKQRTTDGFIIEKLINNVSINLVGKNNEWVNNFSITLNNVGIVGASGSGALNISAVDNCSIVLSGINVLKAGPTPDYSNGANAVNAANILLTGKGSLTVEAGSGANGKGGGAHGYNGGAGISANTVSIGTIDALSVYGGRGGDGVIGTTGYQGTCGLADKGTPACTAGTGGRGGNGGNGGDAISAKTVAALNLNNITAQGGRGGDGGKGGTGGHGGENDGRKYVGTPAGLDGGGGGNGGNGGVGGSGLKPGAGGTGGAAGDGGSPGAPIKFGVFGQYTKEVYWGGPGARGNDGSAGATLSIKLS